VGKNCFAPYANPSHQAGWAGRHGASEAMTNTTPKMIKHTLPLYESQSGSQHDKGITMNRTKMLQI